MVTTLNVLVFVLLTVISVHAYDGHGSPAMGGSAQSITLTVSSLADSGTGTLRAALDTAESMATMFTSCKTYGVYIDMGVSGTITLLTPITTTNTACFTIDGSDQIMVSGQDVEFEDIRHMIVKDAAFSSPFILKNVDKSVVDDSIFFGPVTILSGSAYVSFSDNEVYDHMLLERERINGSLQQAIIHVSVMRNLLDSYQLINVKKVFTDNNVIDGDVVLNGWTGNVRNNVINGGVTLEQLPGENAPLFYINGNLPAEADELSTRSSALGTAKPYQIELLDVSEVECVVLGTGC